MRRWIDAVAGLVEDVDEAAKASGYRPFGQGDRHGAYEWTWWKRPKPKTRLGRFLGLAASSVPEEGRYVLEVWAAAHEDLDDLGRLQRYDRVPVFTLKVGHPKEFNTPGPRDRLLNGVAEGLAAAEQIRLDKVEPIPAAGFPLTQRANIAEVRSPIRTRQGRRQAG